MFDPRRDAEWIGGVKSVECENLDSTQAGARVTRHGGFMGKKFSWRTEVEEYKPDSMLAMRFVEGPMKGGSVVYTIEPHARGSRVSVRNTGPGPKIVGWLVKRSVSKDLARLAELIEGQQHSECDGGKITC